MAHHTEPMAPGRRRSGVNWEYQTYFVAILLLISLPTAIWRWTAGALQPRDASPNSGVMHRALNEAHSIAMTIFSA
jgi:PufQ cytochrome subunit